MDRQVATDCEHEFNLSWDKFKVDANVTQNNGSTTIMLIHIQAQLAGLVIHIQEGRAELFGITEIEIKTEDAFMHHWPTGRRCLKMVLQAIEQSLEIPDQYFQRAFSRVPLSP